MSYHLISSHHRMVVITEAPLIQQPTPPGQRYALDACAVAFGSLRGPVLLISHRPTWGPALRRRIGDQLFGVDDPARPAAQAWIGAVWLEPPRRTWMDDLDLISRELPRGGLLSIVLSLPFAVFRSPRRPITLGMMPEGLWRLRAMLSRRGFRVERLFGFQTIWWSLLRRFAQSLSYRRPDLTDRLQYAIHGSFAGRELAFPFTTTGLIEARAGMRP